MGILETAMMMALAFSGAGDLSLHPQVTVALSECRHYKMGDPIDPALLHHLLKLEQEAGVPEKYQGMMLAKACIESGYKPEQAGDCWGPGGSCLAQGIIQLWPWAEKFGVDRANPKQSVRFFLKRVALGAKTTVPKFCPGVKAEDRWKIAWVRVNRGPYKRINNKVAGSRVARCKGTPHGLSQLRRWQKMAAWKTDEPKY